MKSPQAETETNIFEVLCSLYHELLQWGGGETRVPFSPAFVTHTTPSGRGSTQSLMQNWVSPGSLRSIHTTAEIFRFSVSVLTELIKSERMCRKTTIILWWEKLYMGHQAVLIPLPGASEAAHSTQHAWGDGDEGRWCLVLGPTDNPCWVVHQRGVCSAVPNLQE